VLGSLCRQLTAAEDGCGRRQSCHAIKYKWMEKSVDKNVLVDDVDREGDVKQKGGCCLRNRGRFPG